MVEEKSPKKADRPQGVLNRRYRRYLLGESDIEPRTQAERDIRMNIRQRLYNALLDFVLIYQHTERRDIDMALGRLEGDDRLNRDEAIANAMALFLDLGSGDELADASKFERFVERAAALSWHDRYESDESDTVWLGEPNASLSIDFPNRVEHDELISKMVAIWGRIRDMEVVGEEQIEEDPSARGLGEELGLHTLSTDEVLYLVSVVQLDEVSEGSGQNRAAGLQVMRVVTQTWLLWKQQTRKNFSSKALKKLTAKRQEEEPPLLDYFEQLGKEEGEED